ncbi:FtsX-like permease family protein [bacterium]|nr:FtsX-like permease family protein [bacterium]
MWWFAFRNLLSRPVRSLLALLGLTVAIMGMVGLFSVAAGLQATVDKTFSRVPGMVGMQPGAPIPLFSKIPLEWAEEIAALPGVRNISREVWARAQLVEGKTTFNPPRFIFGCDIIQMLKLNVAVYRNDIVTGRFLTPDDRGLPVCVVSRAVADEYHKSLGDALRVDGYELKIVGIYETNSLLLDVAIVTTGETARAIAQFDPVSMSAVYIEPDGTVPQEELADIIREKFRGRLPNALPANPLNLGGDNPLAQLALSMVTGTASQPTSAESENKGEGLEVRTVQEWGQRIQEFSADLDIFLVIMNSIGVVIALLSILNTMLMSVTERLTEFGVLRANGWTAGDVMRLILAESAILGLNGGILGCGLGVIGTWVLNAQFPTKLNLYASPMVLVISLIFSAVLGTLGGLYPAWWAVRRSPMDAIRRG